MMKNSFFFVLLISIWCVNIHTFSQTEANPPDSLLNRLQTNDIKEKINAYTEILKYCSRVMPYKADFYGEEALKLARENKYAKGEADILYLLGSNKYAQSEYPQAMEFFQQAFEIRKAEKDNVGIAECLNRIGLVYNVQGEFEKALEYCLQSVRILENENDKKALGRAYNHLGIIYYIIKDIPKAEETMLMALDFCEKLNDDLILAVSHEHLGILNIYFKDYEKALFHIDITAKIRESSNDKLGLSGSFDNLAIINRSMGKYEEALKYFQKSIELKKQLNNRRGMAASYSGLGFTYYKLGQIEKGLSYIKESYVIRKELDDKRGMVASLTRLGEIYAETGNYKNAYESIKLSKSYSDTLLNEQKNKSIAQLQEEFQTERKSKEILLLQKENTIQSYFQTFLLILAIMLTIIAFSIFIAYRSKKKTNTLLVLSNKLITEQKEELHLLNDQLKELNATKDKLFSIIAHDLKSPFHGLMGLLHVILEDIKELSLEEIREFVLGMKDSVNTIYKLLENLLEWALFQRDMIIFNPVNLNIREIVNDIIETQKGNSSIKFINVINKIEDNILVYADANMLNTIIRNLLSNAIKFTKKNGKVEFHCSELDGYIQLSITDSGIGISKELIPKLFKADEKTSRPGTEGESNSGLGLVLCKDYIDKHGGKIWLESEVNIGTTFHILLPKEKLKLEV
jgi:signal transduction histidine kinase/Tfp pilus assembly protein PilF